MTCREGVPKERGGSSFHCHFWIAPFLLGKPWEHSLWNSAEFLHYSERSGATPNGITYRWLKAAMPWSAAMIMEFVTSLLCLLQLFYCARMCCPSIDQSHSSAPIYSLRSCPDFEVHSKPCIAIVLLFFVLSYHNTLCSMSCNW